MHNPEITNAIIKRIASLETRKGRKNEGLFKAEGTKCVLDTLPHFGLEALYATPEWLEAHPISDPEKASKAIPAGKGQLGKMTSMASAPEVTAIYRIPAEEPIPSPEGRLMLALDTIQDPGNLGTIIRVADWFGVTDILCSEETASCYSPKVVQATMGSISRVRLHYCPLAETLRALGPVNIYGTFLDGDDITRADIAPEGVIVIGNEGNGISPEVAETVTHRLFIPSWPEGRETGESLNAAIATAVTLAKFRGI